MLPTRIEIVPTDDIVAQVQGALPLSTTLTITSLPHHSLRRTMQTVIQLATLGYPVVPHIAARSLHSRAELAGILRECEIAGILDVFAVGGDGPQALGPYDSALQMMEDIAEISGGRIRIGVAGYPEGHRAVSVTHLVGSLLAKQQLATHIVTQMCFSASKIDDYVRILRREGIGLPVWAGVAGAVPAAKLISLATKIGVGPSVKFLSRKGSLARSFVPRGRYSPDELVSELGGAPVSVAGIHLYSFNSLSPSLLSGLSRSPEAAGVPPKNLGTPCVMALDLTQSDISRC